jgi:hypothetical protein
MFPTCTARLSDCHTSKYVVKTHDGVKKHQDGSPFYDIEIFKNKIKKNKYISDLKEKGYKKRTF